MLYGEIIAVCSPTHTNTLGGQNVEFVNVTLAVNYAVPALCCTKRFAPRSTFKSCNRHQFKETASLRSCQFLS